jgi:L-noviosyl transferase
VHVLFTTAPLYGHFFPLVPLAWAMRGAGHEVLAAVPADFASAVTGAGIAAIPLSVSVGMADYAHSNGRGSPAERRKGPHAAMADSGRGWARLSERLLTAMADAIDDYRPDLVVSEPCEYAGRLAAGSRGVPWVQQSWGLAPSPAFATAAANELRNRLDILGLTELPQPRLLVHPCPAHLQYPDAPAGLEMRYIPYNGAAKLPRWALQPRRRPRVCVTFGSLMPHYGPNGLKRLLVELLERLTRDGYDVMLGMDETAAGMLGPMPPGVVFVGWLPLGLTLPHVDAVVHHGGSGTSFTAMVSGTPQLVMPQATDQFCNAERLQAAGVALKLPPERHSAAEANQAVARLLDDSAFGRNAVALAEECARLMPPSGVVRVLEQLGRTPVESVQGRSDAG